MERILYLLESGEHPKARLACQGYFPVMLPQLPTQGHQGGSSSCSSIIALLACTPSFLGNAPHGQGDWQHGEPRWVDGNLLLLLWSLLLSPWLWQATVCFCVCALQPLYLFLSPCTGTLPASKAANLKIVFPQWPLMMCSQSNQSDQWSALCSFPGNAQHTACWGEKRWSFFVNSLCWLWAA